MNQTPENSEKKSSSRKVMIQARDLWKSYGPLGVLKGLNIDVYEGETLVILGRSGVGKSVLLRQIIGIEQPDKGSVSVEGKNLAELSHAERNRLIMGMGMLFQGSALFDSMNVGENTSFWLRQHVDRITGKKLTDKEISFRVSEALTMVDLPGIEKKMPSDLSGGMKKRAALARLIVYRPHILLYDEPTTGLDPVTAMQINELIIKTQRELKGTSIVVTHDIRSAVEVGDRIAFHNNGVIAHIAPKEDFFAIKDPLLQAFFENAILSPEHLPGKMKQG